MLSPSILKERAVIAMASPGKRTIQGSLNIYALDELIIPPM